MSGESDVVGMSALQLAGDFIVPTDDDTYRDGWGFEELSLYEATPLTARYPFFAPSVYGLVERPGAGYSRVESIVTAGIPSPPVITNAEASLLANWDFHIADGAGRPAGIYPVNSIVDFSQVDWIDGDKAEIKILSTPDTAAGYGFPAIPIDDKQKYKIVIRHKSSAASTDGLYLRLEQYNAALPVGKTHIGFASGGPNVQEETNLIGLVTNGAMPGTSWTVDEYTYTPTAGTKFASFSMSNFFPDTAEVEYHVDYVLMYVIPKTADEVDETGSRKWAGESGADVTGDHEADINIDNITDGTTYKKLLAALQLSPSDNFVDNPDFEADVEGWIGLDAGDIASISDGHFGAKVLQRTGMETGWLSKLIPIDPSKTYYGEFWIRQTVNPTSGGSYVYAGIDNYDYQKNTAMGGRSNSRSYFIASNQEILVVDGWQLFTGYITGAGASLNQFATDARYARPYFIVNYLSGNGTVEVAYFRFTEVNPDNIPESSTRKWAAETGADVTGGHEAATIASQGALATQSSVALNTGEVTNKSLANLDSGADTKLGGIETGADVTGSHQADVDLANLGEKNVDSLVDTANFKRFSDAEDTKLGGVATGADVTGANTAANITGQGTLATLNTVDTAQIDNIAVTNPKITDESVAISAYNTSSTSVSITSVGGGIAGTSTVTWQHSGGFLEQVTYRLSIGGVEFGEGSFNSSNDGETHSATISGLAVPGVGARTVEMEWEHTGNWGVIQSMAYAFEHRGK